jgi:hypothetical protein
MKHSRTHNIHKIHAELFDKWWNGSAQIPELAASINVTKESLSHTFTRMIGRRKKEKA